MVELRNLGETVDSGMAGRGIAQQKERISMTRSVTRRTATLTIVSALLVGLLSTAVVARVFSLAPARDVAGQNRGTQEDPGADASAMAAVLPVADNATAACPGDCQLGGAGETNTTGGATRSAARAAAAAAGVGHLEFSLGEEGAGAARAVHGAAEMGPQAFLAGDRATRSLPIVRSAAGVGDIEYTPGEEPGALPAPAAEREVAPEFGKRP